MRLIRDSTSIDEGCGLAAAELGFAYKKMNGDAPRSVSDDFLSALARGRRRILALPMEGGLVDPVIVIPMLLAILLCVWSPALDASGNSWLGMKALEMFVARTNLSVF